MDIELIPSVYREGSNYYKRGIINLGGVRFYSDLPDKAEHDILNERMKELSLRLSGIVRDQFSKEELQLFLHGLDQIRANEGMKNLHEKAMVLSQKVINNLI